MSQKNDHRILYGDLVLILDFLKEGSAVYEKAAIYQRLFNTSLCHRTAWHFYFQLKI